MELKDKVIVVTGAASGIGRAMALRYAKEDPKHIVCVDINEDAARETASAVGGTAYRVNVGVEEEIKALIEDVEANIGPIDLFCWDINVMAHVWAARHLVPRMSERGGGYLLNTSSAAGLLNQVGSAPYGVTKHAAVGLAEWLAMTYGDQGIKVSVLCPQAVRTEMTRGHEDHVAAIDGMMEPEPVAEACVQTIRDETFLVLPHKEVLGYMRAKTDNYDRWIGGMRKLNRRYGSFDT